MEKIKSFTVNHLILEPGIYVSRTDLIENTPLISYDLRLTRPNKEPVMNTAEIHTIEHLGATYMRNHPVLKDDVIYFGPMGCRTGFYFIMKGIHSNQTVYDFIKDTFAFIATYEGEIPGAAAKDCGNYLDQNLSMANYYSERYVNDLNQLTDISFEYKD